MQICAKITCLASDPGSLPTDIQLRVQALNVKHLERCSAKHAHKKAYSRLLCRTGHEEKAAKLPQRAHQGWAGWSSVMAKTKVSSERGAASPYILMVGERLGHHKCVPPESFLVRSVTRQAGRLLGVRGCQTSSGAVILEKPSPHILG